MLIKFLSIYFSCDCGCGCGGNGRNYDIIRYEAVGPTGATGATEQVS